MYNFSVPDPNLPVSPNNTLGIFEADDELCKHFFGVLFHREREFLTGYTDYQGNLDFFYQYFAPNIANGTSPFYNRIDGARWYPNVTRGVNWKFDGGECELDMQASLPIIYPQNVTLFEVSSFDKYGGPLTGFENFYNRFLDAIDGSYCTNEERNNSAKGGKPRCGIFKPTNVISFSWGSPEQMFPPFWQERQCNEYLKLGLQGVSLFFCSQDWGVGGLGMWLTPTGSECSTLNDHNATGPQVFMPAFPATCP